MVLVRLKDELPVVVESLRSGWVGTCQSAAVVSALLAGLAGQLLVFVKDDSNFPKAISSPSRTCLLLLSYMAVVFNSSATVTSLILIDELGALPFHAARKIDPLSGTTETSAKSLKILRLFGIRASWKWTMCHLFLCLLAGISCIMAQILLYIFLQESNAVKITMACVVVITMLPMLALVPTKPDEESSPA